MGSGIPSDKKPPPPPKAKPAPAQPKKAAPPPKPEPAAQVQAPQQTTQFNARQKWGAAAATIVAAQAFSQGKKAEVYRAPTPEKSPSPTMGGNSTGSMLRTMGIFEQLLYV